MTSKFIAELGVISCRLVTMMSLSASGDYWLEQASSRSGSAGRSRRSKSETAALRVHVQTNVSCDRLSPGLGLSSESRWLRRLLCGYVR